MFDPLGGNIEVLRAKCGLGDCHVGCGMPKITIREMFKEQTLLLD